MTAEPNDRKLTVLLTKEDHDRASAGMRYVYPVLSRRSQGVSIGINLCPNNACNWHCVYCQVPGLVRGAGPIIDLLQLETELTTLLIDIESGQFLEQRVPADQRVVRDFAFSGNGEPTSSPQFAEAIEVVARLRTRSAELSQVPIVLITNGSLADRAPVLTAIARLANLNGRVWFKLDAGTDEGLSRTNGARTELSRHVARLEKVALLCPTWVQSCWFRRNAVDPDTEELAAYLTTLAELQQRGVPVRGVQLYTLARQPQQPEGESLEPVSADWLSHLASRVRLLGFDVIVAS
jgi:wyosine [tRNA(Phe)-imidazoG37] synthetase (radical SAM superfamily)